MCLHTSTLISALDVFTYTYIHIPVHVYIPLSHMLIHSVFYAHICPMQV